MYTDHRPLYYRRETFYSRQAVSLNFYLPYFYRFNETYAIGPKVGVTLMIITKEPGERISWLTFGGPLFTFNGAGRYSHTEIIPIAPLMEEARSRLGSILESQMNV